MKLALFTGMRKGEILNLQWKDINFDYNLIHLRDTKSGKDNTIPLNTEAKKLFDSLPKEDVSSYVFTGRGGKKLVNISGELNRIKKLAELPKDFRPLHGLRSTFATLLASSGEVDIYMLQNLLTHKSPIMTQRYADLIDTARLKSSNVIGKEIDKILSQ